MEKPDHILVIRLSAMGDVAMLVPVLKALTEQYPGVKVTLLTREFFRPIFKDLGNVSVYCAEVKGRHEGFRGLQLLFSELLGLKIEAVADLHNVLRSNILKILFRLRGIPVKQLDKGRREKKALTRRKNKVFKQLQSTHQRYATVFAQMGYPVDLSVVEPLEKQQLPPKNRTLTAGGNTKLLGIAPFAQHSSKVYPEDMMRRVMEELQAEESLRIILFGGGTNEIKKLALWEKAFPNTVSLAGKLSFKEELDVISNLDAMLSMDSGNGHLAANYGVPVVTIWGLTHPYTGFAPFGQPESHFLLPDREKFPGIPTSVYGKEIPEGYQEVMRSISPEKVVEKIKQVIR